VLSTLLTASSPAANRPIPKLMTELFSGMGKWMMLGTIQLGTRLEFQLEVLALFLLVHPASTHRPSVTTCTLAILPVKSRTGC